MGKIRRGGYEFVSWKGDHDPPHVHVYKSGKDILKWNLKDHEVIRGKISKRIRRLIRELQNEGKL